MNNNKIESDEQIYVVIFTSRNKDNKHLGKFQQRTKTFVTNQTVNDLQSKFQAFVNEGQDSELSRFYISLNPRSNKKTKLALQHFLLDNPDFNLVKIQPKVASIDSLKENIYSNKTSKWLFDCDPVENENLEDMLKLFVEDVKESYKQNPSKQEGKLTIETVKTLNGYSVIVDKKFFADPLLSKWVNVELKKDAFLCVDWRVKQ